jgi:cell division septation protein DedD
VQVFEVVAGREAPVSRGVPQTVSGEQPIRVEEVVDVPLAAPEQDAAAVVAGEVPRSEYVLQVAFAREPEDARLLLERLSAKEYAVFIYEVDRGDKGLWYKVLIGPFDDQEKAVSVAERLKTEEQLTAIVKKR